MDTAQFRNTLNLGHISTNFNFLLLSVLAEFVWGVPIVSVVTI